MLLLFIDKNSGRTLVPVKVLFLRHWFLMSLTVEKNERSNHKE